MPLVWCSISSHGFGHAAQIIPVLNELGKRNPNVRVVLRTNVVASFFDNFLKLPWEHSQSIQDIGCVQDGPLCVDIEKTWEAYQDFHRNWEERVSQEAEIIRKTNPDLVLSNISHLGVAAGVAAGISTMALCSLTWDQVLAEYVRNGSFYQHKIIAKIREAYQGVSFTIRPHPCIPMVAFSAIKDVGPILSPVLPQHSSIRHYLNIKPDECVVLIAFGGIPLSSLPTEELECLDGYRFVVTGSMDCTNYTRIDSLRAVGVPFQELLQESDIVMTKPGYATIVECVRSNKPIVYVRRYNFVDEQCLVDYAHQYGRAVELPRQQFESGSWRESLDAVQALPIPNELPPKEGTEDAAELIASFLESI